MTIDAHHHLLDPDRFAYPWLTGSYARLGARRGVEELRRHLGRCGVTSTLLVQTMSSIEEARWFVQLAVETPEIAGVVGWVDLTSPRVAEDLASLQGGPGGELLAGIRHQAHDEASAEWLKRPDVARGLLAVSEAGLVFDLLVRERELPAAVEVVRRQPYLRFVVDHLGKPRIAQAAMEPWATLMRALAHSPNVAVKVSGLVTEARWDSWTVQDLRPYVESALEWFSPERCMVGSDWPVCELAATYEDVWATSLECLAQCSPSEVAAVTESTARSWYRLR